MPNKLTEPQQFALYHLADVIYEASAMCTQLDGELTDSMLERLEHALDDFGRALLRKD